jgi:hypothetical protein
MSWLEERSLGSLVLGDIPLSGWQLIVAYKSFAFLLLLHDCTRLAFVKILFLLRNFYPSGNESHHCDSSYLSYLPYFSLRL